MSKELAPTSSQIDAYFQVLDTRLCNVPELSPGLALATNNPEFAANVYTGYVDLISHMAGLNDDERRMIRDAKETMVTNQGNFGTASEVSADDLIAELGDNKRVLQTLAADSRDPSSPYFKPALDELVNRMEGGHRLKQSNRQPSDDDPESRKVIWGHTMITEPKALVHFMVCHFMERYFAAALTGQGSQLAQQKDFMLNALIDVVLVDHLTSGMFAEIYNVWSAPKDQAGLGWITQDRIDSYSTAA